MDHPCQGPRTAIWIKLISFKWNDICTMASFYNIVCFFFCFQSLRLENIKKSLFEINGVFLWLGMCEVERDPEEDFAEGHEVLTIVLH